MGDVISSHLDEGKREIITARTGEVMGDFGRQYELQYAVALFNKVRFDIEGGGGPTPQLLHRKAALENKSIFSGALFQYLEENKKWRNRFFFVPDSYNINYYDNKSSHDRGLHPKGTINCAGYKVLTSMEQYLDLISNSLPAVKAKVGSSPFLKCATQFPLILWHPYARHYFFCVVSEKEQQKWAAVLQDCVRHANDGLSEESKVQTPAFTDAVRLYRQARGAYGTWDMMCGTTAQILSNLVMEKLLSELRELIAPRLKGKMNERQRNWMLISDAVYGLVQRQCQTQYEALVHSCEAGRPLLEASIRTDMDQIITSKEHVTNKIRAAVLPKAEKLLKVSIEPYITSILDALMEPTSRGFAEVREVFFSELVDMSKNTLNEGTKETVAEHMEKISMLAFHPVKMQSCYEKVEQLSLEGLQQRFDVSSPSVFVQRAQILMREQMDDAVYTFEQILHQSLEAQGTEGLCKVIQRCQDRVIKKFDYDSSTVRKRFFREALLQIFIPYMLKQLTPSCASELPRFQELIFEDFSRFILVENIFEEVVLHSVMKDISLAVKEAAVQRKHNLYRDSIVLNNSDPNLHLLGEKPSVDWTGEYGAKEEEEVVEGAGQEDKADEEGAEAKRRTRMKQVVSMIQVEGSPVLPNASCLEVPGVEGIPEEEVVDEDTCSESTADSQAAKPRGGQNGVAQSPKASPEQPAALTNGPGPEEGDASPEIAIEEPSSLAAESLPRDPESPTAVQSAIQEIDNAVQGEEDSQPAIAEEEGAEKEQIPTPISNEPAATSEVSLNTEVAATSKVTMSEVTPNTEVAATSEATLNKEVAATSDVSSNDEVPATTSEVAPTSEEAATADVSPSKEVPATTSEVAPNCDVSATSDVSSNNEVLAATSEVAPTGEEEAATAEVASPMPSAEQLESTSSSITATTDTEQGPASPLESAPEAAPEVVATTADLPPPPHDDSGFQSPTSEEEEADVVPPPPPPSTEAPHPEEGDAVPPPPPSTEAPHPEEGDVVPPPPPPSTEAPHPEEGDAVPPPPPRAEAPHPEEGGVVPPPPPPSTEAPHPEEGTTTVAKAASEADAKPSDSETGEEDLSKAVMAN